MTITQTPRHWIKYILLIGLITVITACGGGGGGGDDEGSGHQEPPIMPPDATPITFSFSPATDAEPGAEIISNAVTISGINIATPISIVGGEYAIGSGAYTSAAGNVTNGQVVKIKVIASNDFDTDVTATLTVGGVAGSFIATTLVDTTAPTAQITFPPPVSMKDGASILVRGTASDDYSDIASLTVNGVAAESDDGFANWTAQVPLVDGANQLVVVAVDSSTNPNENAANVTVHRAPFDSAFPDNDVPITYANGVTFDKRNNRVLVTNFEYTDGISAVIAVDMMTGKRTILSGPETNDIDNPFSTPLGIVIDSDIERNRALVTDVSGRIFAVDLTEGTRSILSDSSTPNVNQPAIARSNGIVLHPTNPTVAYLVDESSGSLQELNLVTGERKLISGNDMAATGEFFIAPRSLLIDIEKNRVLVGDGDSEAATLFSVDLTTGVRTVISDLDTPQTELPLIGARSMASANLQEYVLVDTNTQGIVKVDLLTGERSQFFSPLSSNPAHAFHYFYLEQGFGYLIYADQPTRAVYAIDMQSKDFVIMSKSETPD